MEKRKPGRPVGAKNKAPLKQREVVLSKNSFEARNPHLLAPPTGLGSWVELQMILQQSIDKHWTDELVVASFSTDDLTSSIENQCHFYSSSKGRVVVDDGSLTQCGLFPGVSLSADFLTHYLHNYTDVENYGHFVALTTQRLRDRARKLIAKRRAH